MYLSGNLLKTKQVSNVVLLSVANTVLIQTSTCWMIANSVHIDILLFSVLWYRISHSFLSFDYNLVSLSSLVLSVHKFILYLSNVFNALQYISYIWSNLENSQRDKYCSIQLFWSKSIIGSEAFSRIWSEIWSNTS